MRVCMGLEELWYRKALRKVLYKYEIFAIYHLNECELIILLSFLLLLYDSVLGVMKT